MTEPTPDLPPPPPPPPLAAAAHDAPTPAAPPVTRLYQATAVIATLGVIAALVGLALLLRPVQTPLQDCGTTLGYLLNGRVDQYGDPERPPKGLTADDVREANEEPCRERVADAARPGATVLAAGLITALGAALVEVGARALGWRRRRPPKQPPGGLAADTAGPS